MAGRKDCLKKLYRTPPHIIHKTYFKLIKDYNVKIILKSCEILGDQRSNLEIRELFKAWQENKWLQKKCIEIFVIQSVKL